jgi:FAD:protein FMN transferase
VLPTSQKVFKETDGAFDPSVFPLVKGWGFMDNLEEPLNQSEVDSLLQFVGFDTLHTISFTGNSIALSKDVAGYKFDFNAIAQGYSVDVLDNFLKKRGQKNYYIEIGGELMLRGTNAQNEKWAIGIDAPTENSTTHTVENCVRLSNEAIATSGNYRKFYEKDGKKYAHCIDPKTGFPVQHTLLSVSVIAPTCAEADAYATAFMVFGTNKTLEFVKTHPQLKLKVYLLESNKDGSVKRLMSDKFKSYLDEA